MDTMLIEYTVQHAPEWLPAVGVLVLLWRISRVLCAALPDIIERVTSIRDLHHQALREMREIKIAHNELHDRVDRLESNCVQCSQNRRTVLNIRTDDNG
jgi:hypothetical protein